MLIYINLKNVQNCLNGLGISKCRISHIFVCYVLMLNPQLRECIFITIIIFCIKSQIKNMTLINDKKSNPLHNIPVNGL